jgi:hypothetical protein
MRASGKASSDRRIPVPRPPVPMQPMTTRSLDAVLPGPPRADRGTKYGAAAAASVPFSH